MPLGPGVADRRGPLRRSVAAAPLEEAVRRLDRLLATPLRLRREPDGDHPDQGYRLSIRAGGVSLAAAGESGLFYGLQTLAQWLRIHLEEASGADLPGLEVRDAPSLPARGVLLDVSRNKVPTMETLFALVDLLASWKINQLQLYTEHTFAYAGHETVWSRASPITPEEVRRLDRYCAERFVELVPNQNSFGHFHRWLVHEPYRRLAERPEGLEHPFSDSPEPFGLCPTDPGSLELLEDLYEQLLPNFTSSWFNVGLDETLDLGTGRSAAACAERGTGRVYLDFLHRVERLAKTHGRRIQYWADVALAHPELLRELPRDAAALVWGYEAGHPFAVSARALADAGVSFYICPGTSSWLSFAGRWSNALSNLGEAARIGAAAGASGCLITDWGDLGHLQPLPVSYLGFLAGSEFGWNAAEASRPLDRDWAALLDLHVFGSVGYGAVARTLGNVYLATGAPIRNGTVLGRLVLSHRDRLDHPRYERLTDPGLARAAERIADAAARLSGLEEAEDRPASKELGWVAGLLDLSCRLGRARLTAGRHTELAELPASEKRRLRRRLDPLLDELPPLWLARNRSGGLADSRRRLERLRTCLDPS